MRQKNLEFREIEVELPRVSAKSLRRVVFHCPLATVNRLLFTRGFPSLSRIPLCSICSRPVMRAGRFAPAAIDSGR
jgi:hypothetical protein